MGANKYQLRRQWSEAETCRWRGLNKTHFCGVRSCRGQWQRWHPPKGSQPVAADARAAGGMRTAADSVVPPWGWQLHFDPMHDSSHADLTKDSQGASIQKSLYHISYQYQLNFYLQTHGGGLMQESQVRLTWMFTEGNKLSETRFYQHYRPKYWHPQLSNLDMAVHCAGVNGNSETSLVSWESWSQRISGIFLMNKKKHAHQRLQSDVRPSQNTSCDTKAVLWVSLHSWVTPRVTDNWWLSSWFTCLFKARETS